MKDKTHIELGVVLGGPGALHSVEGVHVLSLALVELRRGRGRAQLRADGLLGIRDLDSSVASPIGLVNGVGPAEAGDECMDDGQCSTDPGIVVEQKLVTLGPSTS